MKKTISTIYATNKQIPTIIREYIEEGRLNPFLTTTNLQMFEDSCIKFIRATKGKETIVTPMYHEHRQLKLEYFKYYAETRVREISVPKKNIFKSIYNFLKGIKWYGLK